MDYTKAATNACELLTKWSGDTVVPYREFATVMERAYQLNLQIMSGGLVVLSQEEHEALLANQKKRRG